MQTRSENRSASCLGLAFALATAAFACSTQAQQQTPTVADESHSTGAEEVAKGLFAAAKAEYDAGQFEKALLHFQEAYAQSKRPQLLYNLGLAADRLRRYTIALDAFQRYLAELPAAENRVEVENRIRVLRDAVDREKRASTAASKATDHAPSPREAAVAAQATGSTDPTPVALSTPWYARWYTWAGIGGAIAGAVVIGLVASSSSDGDATRAKPNSGVTVQALGASW